MSFSSYSSYLQEGLLCLKKLVLQLEGCPRNAEMEAQVIELMDEYYEEVVGKANPPFYGIFDCCQPVVSRRIYQSPFCRLSMGTLEQPHLETGIRAKLLIVKFLQLRLGQIDHQDVFAYNTAGSVFKLRSRLVSFGPNENGKIIRANSIMPGFSRRYFGFFHEILEVKPACEYGMAPHPSVSKLLFKEDSQIFLKKFLSTCREEMGAKYGWGEICTVNGFLSCLSSLSLIDKDNYSTFEHPPPILTNADRAIIAQHLQSNKWFMLPGRDNFILKCLFYPYKYDFHGNKLEPECDGAFILAQCIRPKLSVCLICGKKVGNDKEFDDTMTKDQLLRNKSMYQLKKFRGYGSNDMQRHTVLCLPMALCEVKSKGQEAELQETRRRKVCYACNKTFDNNNEWLKHCQSRTCIREYFDFEKFTFTKKRKRDEEKQNLFQ